MELTLHSISSRCGVTGRDFVEGERVLSFLVRGAIPDTLGPSDRLAAEKAGLDYVGRFDVAESAQADFAPAGPVVCRWVQIFKPRKAGENPERALKLTAESLFLALGDPANERTPENERLLQVLAIMLERKRVLRPKGRTPDKTRFIYEHAKAKTLHEVAAAELTPEFFLSIQEQLAALVGGGAPAAPKTP
ncbi:MAG: hypothetical protein MUE42_11020 [Opitutaceae bacterium]|jgi:hypothetical protein|nr:hypothetical protein [Opitutaceae bacterium]